jgi:hypothetical protein
MSNPLNTIPLQQFLQQVKAAELAQQKEIKMDMKTAKILALAIGEITARLIEDYDTLLSKIQEQSATGNGEITIRMDGGGFSDK